MEDEKHTEAWESEDFGLNLRLVDAGDLANGYATSTDDGCGSGNTGSDACSDGR